ncbi:hypothetical protein [Ectothiorhodospira variabilis]|uniref:hypothetical protein n=1 Tax=Ectothiorhodospira variabilis TaxID=505694 RepID=UPI001EFA9D73|nr:hypothetical protein [Ectothiorhodospira variabilis]MCG5498645.1 hypothetical protein [Ectothiorhodospira variabilis]
MKQFLRFQISGLTFMLWLVVFGVGGRTEGFPDLVKTLYGEAENVKILAGVVAALPVGVLIHQFSVLFKNCVVGRFWSAFSDYPEYIDFSDRAEQKKYYLDKISNLNSFYYVRVDNGILAPFLAWFVGSVLVGGEVAQYLIYTAILTAIVTLAYIPRIHLEMQCLQNMLAKSGSLDASKKA